MLCPPAQVRLVPKADIGTGNVAASTHHRAYPVHHALAADAKSSRVPDWLAASTVAGKKMR
jgi:hypothetical protein